MIESVKVIEVIEVQLRGGVKEFWSRAGKRLYRVLADGLSDEQLDSIGAPMTPEEVIAMVPKRRNGPPPPFDPREGPVMELER